MRPPVLLEHRTRQTGVRNALLLMLVVAGWVALQTAPAGAATGLRDPTCPRSTTSWTAPASASVARAVEGTDNTCEFRPGAGAGSKTVTLTSGISTDVLYSVGTTVHVSAQTRAADAGKSQRLELQEVTATGTVLQTFSSQRTGTTCGWLGAEIVSTRANSRIRLVLSAVDLTGTNLVRIPPPVRIRNTNVTVTPPPRSYVSNPTCATDTTGWTPSANASVVHAVEGSDDTCELRPTTTAGTKTVTLTSSDSPSVLPRVGTTVQVAAKTRASEPGKSQRLRLQEVTPTGTVLQTSTSQRTGTSFGRLGAQIVSTRPNSRVRLIFSGVDLSGTNLVRAKDTTVTITPRADRPASCEYIDYSDAAQGQKSFNDDFSGSSVDTTKWNIRDNESLSFDAARIRAANVTVHDGLLDIAGKHQTSGGRAWTTGYLDTIGRFSQEYGRWEMRAKVPTDGVRTRGVWPAFWLRGDATRGEVDIMETYGSPATQTYNPSASYEWTIWKDTTKATGDDRFHAWAHPQTHAPAIYSGFHTYAVNWSPRCTTFSFDDAIVGAVDLDDAPWLATSLSGPFNIRLNQQIGSSYWGRPDAANTKPAFNYLIDYVRVYAPLP